jgi:hypothetical protein
MQGKQQDELIVKLLEDEKYQREAFQSLLLQQDHRSQVRLSITLRTTAIRLDSLSFYSWNIAHRLDNHLHLGPPPSGQQVHPPTAGPSLTGYTILYTYNHSYLLSQSLLLQQDHRSQVRLLFTPRTTAIR